MKISWGYKIAGAYLLFVAGIMFLVYKANNETYDLVTENYYEEELKFQNVIDQKERAFSLSALPVIAFEHGEVTIQFPEEFAGKELKGELYLYRPSDAKKDLRKAFAITGTQVKVGLPSVNQGLYDIKLSWEVEGRTYFHEEKKVL